MAVDLAQLNPLSNFNIGLGDVGNALMLVVIVFLIIAGFGWLVWWIIQKKQYRHRIPLYRKVGGSPMRIGTYLAKDYKLGLAGDKLWFVKGLNKYIPPATIQTAPNEYMHYEREDGEWINVGLEDLDIKQKQLGVRYILQDMRSQRIATSELLESRLKNKNFWQKYEHIIMSVIFFLIVSIAMVIIFWQWSKIVESTAGIIGQLNQLIDQMDKVERMQNDNLIPATILPIFFAIKSLGKKDGLDE